MNDATEVLADQVRTAAQERRALRIVGGDTKCWYGRVPTGDALKVSAHNGIVDYDPSELVLTARAGTPILEIEGALAQNNQKLGFEPPIFGPASTIGGVIAAGLAVPSRPFTGAVRDHVLGARILDGRGQSLRFGGTVFKNVAGFDAFRLMCGAMGTLGVILDVSIRVMPRAEDSVSLSFQESWPEARLRLERLLGLPLPIDGAFHDGARLHLRLSGPRAGVQMAAAELGGESEDPLIWDRLRHMTLPPLQSPGLWRLSIPRTANPGDVQGEQLIDWAGGQRWVSTTASPSRMTEIANASGGHASIFRRVHDDQDTFTSLPKSLFDLHKRLKSVFDPLGILNPGRLYRGL